MSVSSLASSCPAVARSASSPIPYIVLCINKDSGSALLWSPKVMEKRFIQKADAKLGDWYEVCESTKTIWPSKQICETRVRDGFIQIKAPIVFFADSAYHNVVGYSPGFGRVGCFVPMSFKNERLCNAWITYVEFFPSHDFQILLDLFSVNWIIEKQAVVPLHSTELHYFSMCGCIRGLEVVKGIVVEKSEDYVQVYTEEYGTCQGEIDPTEDDVTLGKFVKFVPIRNLRNIIRAIHVYGCFGVKGINCIQTFPEIKLSVSCWSLNTKDDRFICVPGLCSKVADESGKPNRRDLKESLVVVYDKGYKDFHVQRDNQTRGPRSIQKLFASLQLSEMSSIGINECW